MRSTGVTPPDVAPPHGAYTQAIIVAAASPLIFLSGQIPVDGEGNTVGEHDASAQMRQVLRNVARLLEANNSGLEHVVKVTIYVTDMAHRGEIVAVRNDVLAESRPASTLVGVRELGDPRWMVELDVVATAS